MTRYQPRLRSPVEAIQWLGNREVLREWLERCVSDGAYLANNGNTVTIMLPGRVAVTPLRGQVLIATEPEYGYPGVEVMGRHEFETLYDTGPAPLVLLGHR